jgi:DNA-binding SARP family transcriptional activator
LTFAHTTTAYVAIEEVRMTQVTRRPAQAPPRLSLLGGFSLVVRARQVSVPIHAQRVLAYLSLVQPGRSAHLRASLAERLWSDVTTERSHASLRTALWRIRQADKRLVQASRETVRLDEAVEVDVRRGAAQAARLLANHRDLQPLDADLSTLSGDLLPGWDEDWLLLERERIHQVQLHALEALSHRLRLLGRHVEAIEAAYAAIAGEPLRESAHSALIDVFLAEENVAQARHHLDQYAALLWTELGIRPSATLTDRITAVGGGLHIPSARTPESARQPTERAHRSLRASIAIVE